jgi:hypothetical protein
LGNQERFFIYLPLAKSRVFLHNSHVTKQQIVIGLCVATFSVRAADPKGYQVTGPVQEINANHIVVQKGEQKWQIAVDKSTKGANVKVGDKVTVYYSMTATEIEAKAGLDFFRPVKPDTIAKSLVIGTSGVRGLAGLGLVWEGRC